MASVALFVHNQSGADVVGVMSIAGWKEIWTVFLKMVAAEPPMLQIIIWLGVAFGALMVLEGLRANFFPRRKSPPQRVENTPPSRQLQGSPASVSYRAFGSTAGIAASARSRNLKRPTNAVSRYRAPRPKIHRMGTSLCLQPQPEPANDSPPAGGDNVVALPQVASFEA